MSDKIFAEKYQQIYDDYLEQDYKNTIFDVIFYVDGKELYAHGQILASASQVFKEQLLQNRSTGNGPIQIDDYTFDEFYEFIRLLYCFDDSTKNKLDKKKIYAIIELAHIYKHEALKECAGEQLTRCGGFRACHHGEELDEEAIKDIFEKIEFAHKYSLNGFHNIDWLKEFLGKYFGDLIGYNGFVNLDKNIVKIFVNMVAEYLKNIDDEYDKNIYFNRPGCIQEEELCEAVYKWAKHHAMVNEEMPKKEKKELILHQIKDILPILNFKNMNHKFLFNFAVEKGFISIDEANKYATIEVTVCGDGSVSGTFVDCYGIFGVIKSYDAPDDDDSWDSLNPKYRLVGRNSKKRRFWDEYFKRPSNPSTVEKMKGCEWYLLLNEAGKLYLKHESLIKKTDYLIAEMKSSNNSAFSLDHNDVNASAFHINK